MSADLEIRVLVADDEESIQFVVSQVLTDAGFEIETVGNGTEALARVKQGGIQIVMTDIRMPGMSGMELLEKVKVFNTDVEVIIMTSHASIDTAIEAIRLGAYDYLTKPFEELEVIQAVVARAAGKIKLEQKVKTLLGALRRRNEEIEKLYIQTTQLFDTLEAEEILKVAVNALNELGNRRVEVVLYGYDSAAGLLVPTTRIPARDAVDSVTEHSSAVLYSPPSLSVGVSGPQEDLEKALCDSHSPERCVVIPLIAGKEFIGAFRIVAREGVIDDTQRGLLRQYIGNASVQLEKARLYATIEAMATTDGLTQIFNRQYFEKFLNAEIDRARRFRKRLGLILFDIDHFKHYNDSNGHPAGDIVLKEVAQTVQSSCRSIDILARYGGEEFVTVVVEADEDGVAQRAESLVRLVSDHEFPSQEKQPLGNLTISAGYAIFPEDANSLEELISAADRAMYAAKHAGRNCVRNAGSLETASSAKR